MQPERLPFDANRIRVSGGVSDSGSSILPLEINSNGGLDVNIVGGGGSGGTASSFNSAFPSTGTAVGASDGTNMQPLLVDGSGYLEVNVKAGGGGGTQYAELNTTNPGTGTLSLGRYLSSLPTLTNAQMHTPMLDSSARLLTNIVNPSSTQTTPGGSIVGLNTAVIGQSSDFWPFYNNMSLGGGSVHVDPAGALVTRGAIMTDEGSFRGNFTGSTPYYTVTGASLSFATGGYGSDTLVNDANSTFLSDDIHYGMFFRVHGDPETDWTEIAYINSAGQIELFAPYPGSTSGTSYDISPVATSTGSGATISVSSGQLTLAAGTTATSVTYVYMPISDGHARFKTALSVSQRIANQDIYVGLESNPAGTITQYARFHLTGTTNTTIVTETGYNPTTTPSSSEMETNSISLSSASFPALNGLTSASDLTYQIDMRQDACNFYINGILVATHSKRLPHAATFGDNVGYGNIRVVNGTTPGSGTSVVADFISVKNYDEISIHDLSFSSTSLIDGNGNAIDNSAVANNTVGENTIAAGSFGQYNSSLPTVTNGNFNAIQIDASGRQLISAIPTNSTSAAVPSTAMPIGGQAVSTEPSSTTATYNTIALTDLIGRLIQTPFTIPSNYKSGTASATGSSSTSLITAVTSNYLYLTQITVFNSSATTLYVSLQDGNGGTTKYVAPAPAGSGSCINFTTPVKNTSGNAWYFAVSGSGASTVYVSATAYASTI